MVETILSHPLFIEIILPFLLIFAVVFAILEKTKILGEGKRQINAIVSLVIGLIFVSFSYAVGIAIYLMGLLAIIAIILFVFMVLYGFISSDKEGFKIPSGLKTFFGILIILVLVIAILVFTGYWTKLTNMFTSGSGSKIIVNIGFIIIIIAAILAVTIKKGGSES